MDDNVATSMQDTLLQSDNSGSISLNADSLPSLVPCEASCFDSCIDLSSSCDQYEGFEIVKSHEFEGWNHADSSKDGDESISSDFIALTMSSMAESLFASFRLTESDFEVIEIESCQNEDATTTLPSVVNLSNTILDRVLRERQQELSALQDASRVSTGDARTNLSQFFNRYNQDVDASENRNSTQSNRRQESRSLPTDVQSLMQQNLVTSALGRGSFRQLLEQTLSARVAPPAGQQERHTIQSRQPPQRSSRQPQARETLRSSLLSEIRNFNRWEPRSLPATLRHEETSLRANQATSNVSSRRSSTESSVHSVQQLSELQQQIQRGVALLSQTINQDLHDLHQFSVVTSVLNGEFRAELENLVQQRVNTVGNGPAVQDFVRNLGINRQPTANGVRSTYRNRPSDNEVFSELQSLKQQMNEMRRMMQMNVEVQLDVQRVLRQEVAAILGAVQRHLASQLQQSSLTVASSPDTSLSSALEPIAEFQERDHPPAAAGACAICVDRSVDAVFYQCGHMCVCIQCGLQLKADGHSCPVCRATIHDVIRTYQNQVER